MQGDVITAHKVLAMLSAGTVRVTEGMDGVNKFNLLPSSTSLAHGQSTSRLISTLQTNGVLYLPEIGWRGWINSLRLSAVPAGY